MEQASSKTATLSLEVSRFYKQQKQLRTIYADTRTSFAEVQRAGLNSRLGFSMSGSFGSISLSSGAFSCDAKEVLSATFAELPAAAERKLDLVSKAKVCFFVSGDSAIDKLALVNELVGSQLMPVDALRELTSRNDGELASLKLPNMKIFYASKLSINLRVLDVFELVEPPGNNGVGSNGVLETVKSTSAISLHDLIMRATGGASSSIKGKAMLEIGMDSALLRNGTTVAVTSSFIGGEEAQEEDRLRELNEDLRILLNHVHAVPYETLSVSLHVTDGDADAANRARSDLLELRPRHVNALPMLVVHRALLGNASDSVFDASFANCLQSAGFNVIDAQAEGGSVFDVMRLSDAAAASELLSSLTDSMDDLGAQSSSNALQPTPRCDVLLVDRLCGTALNRSKRAEPIDLAPAVLHFCCSKAIGFGLKRLVVNGASQLYEAHRGTLQQFILTAFDMARDMQITPKRLLFVREKEQALFDALMALASRKQEEIRAMVADTISNMQRNMPVFIERAFCSEQDVAEPSAETVRSEASKIREHVLSKLNNEIAEQLVHSVNVLRESYTGTLARCVRSLETENPPSAVLPMPVSVPASAERSATPEMDEPPESSGETLLLRSQSLPAVTDPQSTDTVHLTAMLHGRFGMPSRADSSYETQSAAASAIDSLKRIIASIYSFDITLQTSSSFVRALLERVRELLRSAPWNVPARVDNNWRVTVAREMLTSLSDTRLARCVSTQIRDKLRNSHDQFASALRSLESKHSDRLGRAESIRNELRKRYTPRIARLLLEAISLRDVTLFGVPQHGRELGRGQYGVVYACDAWANHGPCAVKSVVPPDERHWNDLALEFYYTRRIGEHDRVVTIRGCVIDYSYLAVSGAGPAVLLVMERLLRDLHQAIRLGIDWLARTLMPHDRIAPYYGVVVNYDHVHTRRTRLPEVRFLCQLLDCDLEVALMHSALSWGCRLQITIDVVEGLRYLHSQGLVHRDIKLKNVLLDKHNRAKITDLGFCKPEAMMSGSIVGTPIHMAPELFSGKYDASVDVYAFGILFWYICAGHVRLPSNLDQCTSKDMLWSSVRRGVRPERLPHFEDWCWQLMTSCWVSEPSRRILLGDAEPILREKLEEERRKRAVRRSERTSSSYSTGHRRSRSNSPMAIHDRGQQ